MREARGVREEQNMVGVVSIAPLAIAEIDELIALAGVTWRAHYPGIISVAQIEYMLAQRYNVAVIRGELERDVARWDVLRVDGEMAAFASYFASETPRAAKLDKLYVHPAHQRKGYGGRLIGHVCAVMGAQGSDALMLAVNKHNAKAIAAYRKHGFNIAESVTKNIGEGFVMDDYIMVKRVKRERN